MPSFQQFHASCVARGGAGVLLLGPPGSGKSNLALRLISNHGYSLVADDRVDMEDGLFARAPPALAGLLEVRGFGIIRLPHTSRARVVVAIALAGGGPRLPAPGRHPELGLPQVVIDPVHASAPCRVTLAVDCALGHANQVSGAFAE